MIQYAVPPLGTLHLPTQSSWAAHNELLCQNKWTKKETKTNKNSCFTCFKTSMSSTFMFQRLASPPSFQLDFPHPPRWSLHPSNSAQQYVDIPRSKPPSWTVGPNPEFRRVDGPRAWRFTSRRETPQKHPKQPKRGKWSSRLSCDSSSIFSIGILFVERSYLDGMATHVAFVLVLSLQRNEEQNQRTYCPCTFLYFYCACHGV